jgi:RNA polymerase sigma factor (sigma-70 family)
VTQLLFGALVARYQDAAFAYAYAILRDYAAAEDATQAAFLNAWLHWSDLREPEAFGGWLRTIVRTECYRITRRARLDTVPLDESQARAELEEQEITKWETRTLLLNAIGGLSESDRALIALRYMSELSYQHGDVSAVAVALDAHPELLAVRGENERFWCGSTNPFAIAVASGQLEIVKLFIDRGAHRKIATTDVEALLDAGMPIDIFAAAALGNTEQAAELIRMNSAVVGDRSFDGKTPLQLLPQHRCGEGVSRCRR